MLSTIRNSFVSKIGVRNFVGVVGVPFEKGQRKEGVALAPDAIRRAGLIDELKNLAERKSSSVMVISSTPREKQVSSLRENAVKKTEKISEKIAESKGDNKIFVITFFVEQIKGYKKGLDVKDYGNIKYEAEVVAGVDNMSHLGEVAACTRELSQAIQNIMKEGRKVVTLGGDHSVGVGAIDGHVKAKGSVGVLWVDAHADLNTNKTSDSGNVHGMPVALLTSELSDYWPHLPGMDWQMPMLSIRNVAYIGLRSVDKYERLVIEKFGITAFGMEDVERYGIHEVVHMALKKIDPHSDKSLHISFDIDALDPLEAPSTGTAVRGGLSLREGIHLMEEVYRTNRLNAIDLVEVNPEIGDERSVNLTTEAAIYILQAGLGYTRRGLKVPAGVTDIPLQTFH